MMATVAAVDIDGFYDLYQAQLAICPETADWNYCVFCTLLKTPNADTDVREVATRWMSRGRREFAHFISILDDERGDMVSAERYASMALLATMSTPHPDPLMMTPILTQMAKVMAALGRGAEAIDLLASHLSALRKTPGTPPSCIGDTRLALCFLERRAPRALAHARVAFDMLWDETDGHPPAAGLAAARAMIAGMIHTGRLTEAIDLLECVKFFDGGMTTELSAAAYGAIARRRRGTLESAASVSALIRGVSWHDVRVWRQCVQSTMVAIEADTDAVHVIGENVVKVLTTTPSLIGEFRDVFQHDKMVCKVIARVVSLQAKLTKTCRLEPSPHTGIMYHLLLDHANAGMRLLEVMRHTTPETEAVRLMTLYRRAAHEMQHKTAVAALDLMLLGHDDRETISTLSQIFTATKNGDGRLARDVCVRAIHVLIHCILASMDDKKDDTHWTASMLDLLTQAGSHVLGFEIHKAMTACLQRFLVRPTQPPRLSTLRVVEAAKRAVREFGTRSQYYDDAIGVSGCATLLAHIHFRTERWELVLTQVTSVFHTLTLNDQIYSLRIMAYCLLNLDHADRALGVTALAWRVSGTFHQADITWETILDVVRRGGAVPVDVMYSFHAGCAQNGLDPSASLALLTEPDRPLLTLELKDIARAAWEKKPASLHRSMMLAILYSNMTHLKDVKARLDTCTPWDDAFLRYWLDPLQTKVAIQMKKILESRRGITRAELQRVCAPWMKNSSKKQG
jgi:hypothetical protein